MKKKSAIKVPVYAVIREGNTVSKKRCVRLSARTASGTASDLFEFKGLTKE